MGRFVVFFGGYRLIEILPSMKKNVYFPLYWLIMLFDFSELCGGKYFISSIDVYHWKPPAANMIKVNVDASFLYSNGSSKSGMVSRNVTGKILCYGTSTFDTTVSPLHAELNVVLNGLILAESQGYDHIILETDSLVVVQEIYRWTLSVFGSPLSSTLGTRLIASSPTLFNFST